MFGKKIVENDWVVEKEWAWARPEYSLLIDIPYSKIRKLRIDPSGFMADIDLSNNVFEKPTGNGPFKK